MKDTTSILAKSAARLARRAQRIIDNAALGSRVAKKGKRKKSPSMSKLKKLLWAEISQIVRSWSAVCLACGIRATECAAHIVPSNEGAATRYFLPNLYPCCLICNGLEKWNRASWVYHHREMFGTDYVDALYAYSDTMFQVKKDWVLEQTERMKKLRGTV